MSAFFLTTERIGFRAWTAEDFPLALALWGDPQVTKLIDARGQLSEDQVRERLSREIATQQTHGIQYWPIFLLGNSEHLGCAGLRPYKLAEGILEIGVHLRAPHWGHGYATEAARGVMAFAFDQLAAKALFAGHNPKNDSSRRFLAKISFRYTHDEFYPPTGLNHPSYLLTAAEYEELRKL
jgi:[ribosomal protein S5]-alanine N-acetyltransferase